MLWKSCMNHPKLYLPIFLYLTQHSSRVLSQTVSSAVQAIHCRLSDVIPLDGETWSDACTKRFISLAHQKLVTIVATGTVCMGVCELVN